MEELKKITAQLGIPGGCSRGTPCPPCPPTPTPPRRLSAKDSQGRGPPQAKLWRFHPVHSEGHGPQRKLVMGGGPTGWPVEFYCSAGAGARPA